MFEDQIATSCMWNDVLTSQAIAKATTNLMANTAAASNESSLIYSKVKKAPAAKKIPAIKDIKVFNNKATKVYFANGDIQTAVCADGDVFDLETAIILCIAKELCGKNLLSQVQAVKDRIEKEEKAKEAKIAAEKAAKEALKLRHEKTQKRKLLRRAQYELALEALKKELKNKKALID